MSKLDTDTPRPAPSEYWWWTFTPLYSALFIVGAYFLFYMAFVSCSLVGGECKPVDVKPLLCARGWCGAAAHCETPAPVAETNAQADSPPPAASPTPAVYARAEGGAALPQVNVYVTLPPAPPPPPAPAPAPPAGPTEDETRAAVYPARLMWMVIYAIGIITTLVALYTCAYVIWSSLRERFKRRARRRAVALAFAAGLATLAALLLLTGEKNMPVLVPLIDCVVQKDVAHALWVVAFGNALALALAAVALLASCATLWPVRKDAADAVAEIAARVRLLRLLLYVGMVALAVAILRLSATFGWALAALPSTEADHTAKLINIITNNVTSAEAASYTLLLAAIYVPAVLVLRRRARSLIPKDKKTTSAAGDKWLEENGLNITASLKTLLPKLAAILAPLLVGAVGEFIKGINVISQ